MKKKLIISAILACLIALQINVNAQTTGNKSTTKKEQTVVKKDSTSVKKGAKGSKKTTMQTKKHVHHKKDVKKTDEKNKS